MIGGLYIYGRGGVGKLSGFGGAGGLGGSFICKPPLLWRR